MHPTTAAKVAPVYFEGFAHDDMQIINPTCCDPRGMACDPRDYGFAVESTGGGFTALVKHLPDGRYIMLTNPEGEGEFISDFGEDFLLGFYDAEGNTIGTWEMKVGEAYNCPEDAVEGDDTPVSVHSDYS